MAKSSTRATADVAQVVGRKNLIINGGFDVWQRGTSFTSSEYTADRWALALSGGACTVTKEAFTVGQADVPNNPTNFLKANCTTGDNNCGINQPIEDVRNGAGENVTVSFWAKGTNPNSGSFDFQFIQRFGSGGSANVTTTQSLTVTSSWAKYTATFAVPSISGKTIGSGSSLDLTIRQPSGDASTAAWDLSIANVQVELGSVATEFEHRSYGEELALCERYLQYRNYVSYVEQQSSSYRYLGTPLIPVMRATPSITRLGNWISGANESGTAIDYAQTDHTGVVMYQPAVTKAVGGKFKFDAEL